MEFRRNKVEANQGELQHVAAPARTESVRDELKRWIVASKSSIAFSEAVIPFFIASILFLFCNAKAAGVTGTQQEAARGICSFALTRHKVLDGKDQ